MRLSARTRWRHLTCFVFALHHALAAAAASLHSRSRQHGVMCQAFVLPQSTPDDAGGSSRPTGGRSPHPFRVAIRSWQSSDPLQPPGGRICGQPAKRPSANIARSAPHGTKHRRQSFAAYELGTRMSTPVGLLRNMQALTDCSCRVTRDNMHTMSSLGLQ